jgi:hypothetical protein
MDIHGLPYVLTGGHSHRYPNRKLETRLARHQNAQATLLTLPTASDEAGPTHHEQH